MVNVVHALHLFNPQIPLVDGLLGKEVFPVSHLALAHEGLIEQKYYYYYYYCDLFNDSKQHHYPFTFLLFKSIIVDCRVLFEIVKVQMIIQLKNLQYIKERINQDSELLQYKRTIQYSSSSITFSSVRWYPRNIDKSLMTGLSSVFMSSNQSSLMLGWLRCFHAS